MSNTTDSYEELLTIINGSKPFQVLMENPNVSLKVIITNANPTSGENSTLTSIFHGHNSHLKSIENNDSMTSFDKDWRKCFFFGRPSLILRGRPITEKEREWASNNNFFIYDIREKQGEPVSVEHNRVCCNKYGTLITWIKLRHDYVDYHILNSDFNDFMIDEESDDFYQIDDLAPFKSAFNEKEMLSVIKDTYMYSCASCNRCFNCAKGSEFREAYKDIKQCVNAHAAFISKTPKEVASSIIQCKGYTQKFFY